MNKLGINFIENVLYQNYNGLEGVIAAFETIDQDLMRKFMPRECWHRSCVIWDFEEHTVSVCEDYMLSPADIHSGAISSVNSFVVRPDLCFSYEVDFDEFLSALRMEKVSFHDVIKRDPDLASLLGF